MLKTIGLAENSLLSMTEDAEVGSVDSGNRKDETVKKSPLTSKNLNRATRYLTPHARLAFI